MHNLLLESDKERIKKEYWMRLIFIFWFILLFLGIILFLALLPSYIFSWSKEKSFRSQKTAVDQSVLYLENENLNSLTLEVKEKVGRLKEKSDYAPIYIVIEKILAHKNSGISITGFTFQPENTKGRHVTIEGISNSRDILVQFSKNLEKETLFNVSLPVSNFAKKDSIDFTLDITIKNN